MLPLEGAPLWSPPRSLTLLVRARSARASRLAPAVRDILNDMDHAVPLGTVATMEGVVARSLSQRTFAMLLLAIAAVMALAISLVGLYGAVAYAVGTRSAEIGMRVALGASKRQVAGLVLRDAALLGGIGAAVGLAVALGVTRVLRAMLFGVAPTDALTFAVVTILLLGVTALASAIPARRALRIDPMEALRHE